jgi:tetratricopeptide (TPR) repeat protein
MNFTGHQAADAAQSITNALTDAANAAQKGEFQRAENLYRQVRLAVPTIAGIAFSHGKVLSELGRMDEAAEAYRHVVSLNPDHAGAWSDLGNILFKQRRYTEAEIAYRRALALKTGAAELSNLACALMNQDRLDEAENELRRAMEMAPDFASAHANLGNVLAQKGQWAQSIESYREAIRLDPTSAVAWSDLGHIYLELDQGQEALAAYDQALAIRADYSQAALNRALALLRLRQHEAGWHAYEERWKVPPHSGQRNPAAHVPRWRGESLEGKRLLVWHEQGLGDTIQFCRYAADLAALGAQVIMLVPTSLIDLIRGVPGVVDVVSEAGPEFQADFQIPLMSVPHVLQRPLGQSIAPLPYLHADAQLKDIWQKKMSDINGLKVGLAWSGDPRPHDRIANLTNRRRSVSFTQLAPLAKVKGITFISLQKGIASDEADSRAFEAPFWDKTADLHSFSDTAALIASLDLVITVDTSVAHLAIALGKPVWVLLRLGACWRWSQDTDTWYPNARLFRQAVAGDWAPVIDRIVTTLEDLTDIPESIV